MSRTDHRRSKIGVLAFVAVVAISSMVAIAAGCSPQAAAYPSKPINVIVPFAAGGTTDLVARVMGTYLQQKWNQPVTVVDKAGGGGTPGTVDVLQAPPDGYTMGFVANSNGVLNDALQKNLPYHWDSLTDVARVSLSSVVFCVKSDSKYTSLKDLAADLKKDPSKFSVGSSGVSGPSMFAMAQLAQSVGADPTKVRVVAFDGGAPSAAALAGGHVDFVAQNLPEVIELINGGQIRPLAVTTPQRDKLLPNVPTTAELGFPAVTTIGLFGLVAPPKLPDSITQKWDDALSAAMKDPNFTSQLEKIGSIPAYQDSKDFHAFMESQYKDSLAIAEKLGLRK